MTTTLVILDGWGHRIESKDNAINNANTPNLNSIYKKHQHRLIASSGKAAGLPDGQMGNSEVGHITIGSGRIVPQSLTRIDNAIADGSFHTNSQYLNAIGNANKNSACVHLIGMLSDGGVHSHQNHIFEFLKLATNKKAKVALHLITDGRDTAPNSALNFIDELLKYTNGNDNIKIASVTGRFFSMDRDNRWQRTQQAYNAIVNSVAKYTYNSIAEAIEAGYNRGESDEFISPSIIEKQAITAADSIVFINFRADRARQLTYSLVDKKFDKFEVNKNIFDCYFAASTNYDESLNINCAFDNISLKNNLGEYLANSGKTQLRIAETEKYAHITYFFSSGIEQKFKGENRILVNSPDVKTYDLQPEMSAYAVVAKVCDAIANNKYDFIVVNLANADMVGHTGIYEAAITAAEVIDDCIGKIYAATTSSNNQCFITADHGNLEQMYDENSQQAHTSHTTNPVPLIYFGRDNLKFDTEYAGGLCDIAPTILFAMNLEKPKEMQGRSLLK